MKRALLQLIEISTRGARSTLVGRGLGEPRPQQDHEEVAMKRSREMVISDISKYD